MACAGRVFAQITVGYVDHAIAIGGAKPHGRVAIYSIGQAKDVTEILVRNQAVVRADDNGNVTFPVQVPTFRSVWVIFDVTTGDYLVSSPPGYKMNRVSPPAGSLGTGDGIRNPRLIIDAFVARKGAGAWAGRAADRKRSGSAAVPVSALVSLERDGPPPPQKLTVGDVVFGMDVTDMEFWVLQVRPGDVKEANDAH